MCVFHNDVIFFSLCCVNQHFLKWERDLFIYLSIYSFIYLFIYFVKVTWYSGYFQEGILRRKVFSKQGAELLAKCCFRHLLTVANLLLVFLESEMQHISLWYIYTTKGNSPFGKKRLLWQLMSESSRWERAAQDSSCPLKIAFAMRMWCRRWKWPPKSGTQGWGWGEVSKVILKISRPGQSPGVTNNF